MARWATKSNALSIVGVRLDAKLRRDKGHAARLWMADSDQRETARIAAGGSSATDYQHETWSTSGYGQRQFVASLSCQRPAGCPQSNSAKTFVRNVRLKLADHSDPQFTAFEGTLLGGGWLRAAQNLHVQAQGDVALGLIQVYRALGGGWQIRCNGCEPRGVLAEHSRSMPTELPRLSSSPPVIGAGAILGAPEAVRPGGR